jgi:hypothetical protein
MLDKHPRLLSWVYPTGYVGVQACCPSASCFGTCMSLPAGSCGGVYTCVNCKTILTGVFQ